MLGQFICEKGQTYNVVILAGGLSTRMGSASEYIPKALTKIGTDRAIDLLINKFLLVSHQLVIGTSWHADLLESYISGRYQNQNIRFSREPVDDLRNNATSLLYALDNIDSRHGTIVSFCDLLLLSNPIIAGSSLYVATAETKGVVGTFRHSVTIKDGMATRINVLDKPSAVNQIDNGIIGQFVFANTLLLKEIAYSLARSGSLVDITTDIVTRYVAQEPTRVCEVSALLEFGTEADLKQAREFWESH